MWNAWKRVSVLWIFMKLRAKGFLESSTHQIKEQNTKEGSCGEDTKSPSDKHIQGHFTDQDNELSNTYAAESWLQVSCLSKYAWFLFLPAVQLLGEQASTIRSGPSQNEALTWWPLSWIQDRLRVRRRESPQDGKHSGLSHSAHSMFIPRLESAVKRKR